MSVYTSVSDEEMRQLLTEYNIGEFKSLQGIAQGITNSNYFLHTSENSYVLTVFETLRADELPFFMELTQHLSANGVACPAPIAKKNGDLTATLANKPACIVSKLTGCDTAFATEEQCFSTGAMLAKMHLASKSFTQTMLNPRHAAWWTESSEKLLPFLDTEDAALLTNEIAFLAQHPDSHLPSGIIHADLFKDNVLLNQNQVSGFIDFYYACNGSFVYDLAIAINDWARNADNHIVPTLRDAFMRGYQSVRTLEAAEKEYLPVAYRAGCVRFWVSRLLDYHFPAEGEMTFIKDPNVFRNLLNYYRQQFQAA
ncbi:homoserine kinase [Kingella negevensis]|uniref:Homoserine kinase n=1 Tax=Kingella negevensis TaxID=1522312 RepID=A0A238HEX7_9NEIS|nr:homoserine kinase [Kingella negevensis]MDK4680650.1 homoserine kinase [Kingella negevensis]MDK4681627.1 homoserine kinase [Kingella negevensis]MDK4683711.1 homoserine kinase [Kingella negevensis]MDK4689825.1 homoserine kinase [Kingella negevensis]MDK4692831.1 homoserine kinase [Kingella negevensis]